MTQALIIVAASAFAAIISWLLRGSRAQVAQAQLTARIQALEEDQARRADELSMLKSEHEQTLDQLHGETERRAAAEARNEAERQAGEEKLKLLNEAEASLTNAFKALSADALKHNNQSFLQLASATLGKFQETAKGELEARQKAVDALAQPIRESLQKVDGKLGEIEKARVGAYAELSTQVKGLVETHLPMLRNETANLVKALRQPTVRGRWGEIQLKRVVEMAGMLDHCDFMEQENRNTEDGRLRPDLVVKLPGGKSIVVDAKAAVSAYLEATEAPDEDSQRLKLADHARQVRAHMSALGRKNYWEQFDPTPELVVMFLPGEMFFSAALQQDPGLIEFGVNEKVVPATPTTLIALLRAVAYGWRQEALAKNAQEVARLGKELYERVSKLGEHWAKLGQRLGRTVDAYNSATATLESRVLVSARSFGELKVSGQDKPVSEQRQVEKVPRLLQAEEFAGTAQEQET